MNDLFSGSFPRTQTSPEQHVIQMSETPNNAGLNLDKFFQDVEAIKDDLHGLDRLNDSLWEAHEKSKTLHNAKEFREVRARMDADVAAALNQAKMVKVKLEALDRANSANRNIPGCGQGSSLDRTRTSVVNGLRKKLKECMERFGGLREKITVEYRETVQRRYFTVTGEEPDEKTLDRLISTGESETFLQRAIHAQGRGRILDTINEIHERHDAVKEIEKNLKELHQVFLDMSVLVQVQGEQLDDIESNLQRAGSYVESGTRQLQIARNHQKNARKWTCCAIVLLLIIILIVTLVVLKITGII